MNNRSYVHGFSDREAERLSDQANTLSGLLHHDSLFPAGSLVLEAGCGTGAQTVIIAPQNPDCRFVSIELSPDSLKQAEAQAGDRGIHNVTFQTGDIFNLPYYPAEHFDHVFVCFVLEHLPNPGAALQCLKRVLKKGGTMTVIEGDHGSAYFYPESEAADRAIQAQVTMQAAAGGNANIGRRLYPLLKGAGLEDVRVSPRLVYADSSRPEMVEGFTRNTFTAMIEGIREKVLRENVIEPAVFDQGIRDLYRTSEEDGMFCYTFFKGVGSKLS